MFANNHLICFAAGYDKVSPFLNAVKKYLLPSIFPFYIFVTLVIQIIKQIRILQKDHMNKYKMQFMNDN